MKVPINVEAKDIKNGEGCSSRTCPIALAAKRVIKPNCIATVGPRDITFDFSSIEIFTRTLPKEARMFVLDFDCERKVKPFSFTLDIPDSMVKS